VSAARRTDGAMRSGGHVPEDRPPRVVLTVADAAADADPAKRAARNALYADGVRRHGGEPVLLDAGTAPADRDAALAIMDGLLLTGGADLDPGTYGQPVAGAGGPEAGRDDLERTAWAAAAARGAPVLGICRGLQAINVFSGGTLLQHVDGHSGPALGEGPALVHPLTVEPGTRLAVILGVHAAGRRPGGPSTAGEPEPLAVNSYHHQAVRPGDLAPGLVASAFAGSPVGPLVEALEAPGVRFVVGVQCHPERLGSTPPAFDRLWAAFVAACREAAATGR
jgi:putative glutamine amidotransferase